MPIERIRIKQKPVGSKSRPALPLLFFANFSTWSSHIWRLGSRHHQNAAGSAINVNQSPLQRPWSQPGMLERSSVKVKLRPKRWNRSIIFTTSLCGNFNQFFLGASASMQKTPFPLRDKWNSPSLLATAKEKFDRITALCAKLDVAGQKKPCPAQPGSSHRQYLSGLIACGQAPKQAYQYH